VLDTNAALPEHQQVSIHRFWIRRRMGSASRWIVWPLAVLITTGTAVVASPAHTDAELRQWTDDTLNTAIDQRHASGIAVAIVLDGKLAFLKGYGHADSAGKVGVDPNETPFSIGSITKSFTATAVAQLLERGVIHSLDDPANNYLRRIQLPRKNNRDVTVRNLVTHRAGIDESIYDLATLDAVPVPIAAGEILERLPPIVRTPGEISVYSNIGYGVLGILIEDVTGLTYGEYLRQNVFVPLDMVRSYVRYKPQEPIAQPMEYLPNGAASPIPQGWAYHPFISSSASVVSTAQDMAKFALGQLNAELGTAPALMNAATARLMHDRSIANAPSVSGFGMSFIANTWNGTRVTENAGSGPGFQALFILLPDLQTGFVALIMGGGKESLKMFALREAFLNFYLGPLQPMPGPLAGAPMNHYTGIYRSERRSHATSEAVFSPGTTLDVKTDGNDALRINGQRGYHEIAAGTFWKPGIAPYVPNDASSDMYVFVPDANGKIKYVAPYLAVDVYKPAYLDPTTFESLTIALCVLCGTGLLAFWWPVTATAGRFARILAIFLGAFAAAIPLVLAESLRIYGSPIFMLGFGHVLPLQIATTLATGCTALTILLAALTIRQRLRPGHNELTSSRLVRWHLASLSIAGIALTAAFAHYNLLGDHVP
jgi:CubicO group peptidase (beta-lactamase class C family)